MRDQTTQPVGRAYGPEVAGPVEGVEPGVGDGGGVADVVQPRGRDEELSVLGRHDVDDGARCSGHPDDVVPPVRQRVREALRLRERSGDVDPVIHPVTIGVSAA